MNEQVKIAVLIDAENISSKYIKLIMDEVSNYGIATYKRVYGDFAASGAKAWRHNLRDYAITPFFQINYTQGKNASDSALIIDAMDILYSGNADGFCLVTSDSDFTKLAMRLRESAMLVIGMGEQKTPQSLVSACEKFIYLDVLNKVEETDEFLEAEICNEMSDDENSPEKNTVEGASNNISSKNTIPSKEEICEEIKSIIVSSSIDEEWVYLSTLGNALQKRAPGFDPRNYNCRKLKDFIESFDCFELSEVPDQHNELIKIVYVKLKE